MPLKNNTSAYQRLKEDIDSRAAQYNQTQEAIYNATHPVSSKSSPKTEEAKRVRQRQLKNMGLYTGEIDGKWGKKSEAAHREALRRGYTYSNGMYSQKPKAMQPIAGKPLTDTQKRQAQLKEMGFYQGKIDDKFGPMSRAAHQKALEAGYTYENGRYTMPMKQIEPTTQTASMIPDVVKHIFGGDDEQKQKPQKGRAIYVDFDEHGIDVQNDTGFPLLEKAAKALGVKKVPLGHSGVVLVDENGKTKYYDYGRYGNDPHIIGVKGNGNYRRLSVPDMREGESLDEYTSRLAQSFPEETSIKTEMYNGVDIGGAEQRILQDARDKNRKGYSIFGKNCKTVARDAATQGSLSPLLQIINPAYFAYNALKNSGNYTR